VNLDLFPKESQETEVESIVVTPSISSSNESLELFAMVHQVTPNVFLLVNIWSSFLSFFIFLSVIVMFYH